MLYLFYVGIAIVLYWIFSEIKISRLKDQQSKKYQEFKKKMGR